jgi:hypothetical protein
VRCCLCCVWARACFVITFAFQFQELLKRAEKDAIETRRAPVGGDDQTDEVPKMEVVRPSGGSPTGGGSPTASGHARTTAVTDVNASQRSEDIEC